MLIRTFGYRNVCRFFVSVYKHKIKKKVLHLLFQLCPTYELYLPSYRRGSNASRCGGSGANPGAPSPSFVSPVGRRLVCQYAALLVPTGIGLKYLLDYRKRLALFVAHIVCPCVPLLSSDVISRVGSVLFQHEVSPRNTWFSPDIPKWSEPTRPSQKNNH